MKKIFLAISVLFLVSVAVSAQRIEAGNRRTIGYISSDGTVEDSSRRTIGYAEGVKMEHAAAFFFFFFYDK